MDQTPYLLDRDSGPVVLQTLREGCWYRGEGLLAAHVRTNHVHVVVEAEVGPEKIMNDFTSYASRALNCLGHDAADRKRWARQGSTRLLWKDEDVQDAIGVCRRGAR